MRMSQNKSKTEQNDRVPFLSRHEINQERLQTLISRFKEKFKVQPEFVARAPGRVNLIGEHVDYCGYAVCPMAIEQDILIAVAPSNTNDIRLTNVDENYCDFECSLDEIGLSISDTASGIAWYKYFLCGVNGALQVVLREKSPSGLLATVSGNIPPNAGLSSSSALVSAAVLSTMYANKCDLTKHELATISARSEVAIGTQGGGMDQAIAFLGKRGSAMLIEFDPLTGTDVILPEKAAFVIAHSQVSHNKAASYEYNLRVTECRLAAKIIAKKRNKDWKSVNRLIDIQTQLGVDLDEMISIVTTDLHYGPYLDSEICRCLEINLSELKKISWPFSIESLQMLQLRQRAEHVFKEANRVHKFRRVTEREDLTDDEKLKQLGDLLAESHQSLTTLYECSHPKVDSLVVSCMQHGALGAKVTGAGWGGCIVAIVEKDKVHQLVENLKAEIAKDKLEDNLDTRDLVFQTQPNYGASLYLVN